VRAIKSGDRVNKSNGKVEKAAKRGEKAKRAEGLGR